MNLFSLFSRNAAVTPPPPPPPAPIHVSVLYSILYEIINNKYMELLFSVFSYYIIDRSINNQTGGARNKVKHDIEKITFYLELNALESLKILYKWRHQWSNGRFTPNNEGVKINNWKQYSKKSIQSIKSNKITRRASN